jgi:AcrR family transcriptional regulator
MRRDRPVRERLIEAGVDLVMTDGAAALGLREIARRAGVSHGAPRRYFPTHHALLSAIAHRGFADLEARLAAAAGASSSPRDRLRALATAYIRYALECRGMFELMFRHDLLDSDKHASDRPRLRDSTLPLFESLVGLIAQHQAGRDTAPAITAAALWSNLHGIARLWAWGSLQLVLGIPQPGQAPEGDRPGNLDHLDRLVTAVLDAHLGPVNP